MILSDDTAKGEDTDSVALSYLILVQEIFDNLLIEGSGVNNIDMVVEILNPKNYDIVSSYSTKNIVISNRYISKMIMQIGEKESLFSFYQDILTYDEAGVESPDSKELYIKKADEFFCELPEPCSAADLIRAIWYSSPNSNKSIMLGYFNSDGKMILFENNQLNIPVNLSAEDRLIIFSNH